MTDNPGTPKRILEFRIERKRLKWGWIIDAQAGDYKAITNAMAASLLDGNGEYVPFDQAYKILYDLDGDEIDKVMDKFRTTFRDWSVPPQIAAS